MTTSRKGLHKVKHKVYNHLRKRHHRMLWAFALGVTCACLYMIYKLEIFKIGTEVSTVPVFEAFISGFSNPE